jgi:transposase
VLDRCLVTERKQSYPSDSSEEQWALIEPLLPAVNKGGRPEKHPRRAIVDAILYVVGTGCAWRQLPADFPPWHRVLIFRPVGTGQGHRADPARRTCNFGCRTAVTRAKCWLPPGTGPATAAINTMTRRIARSGPATRQQRRIFPTTS